MPKKQTPQQTEELPLSDSNGQATDPQVTDPVKFYREGNCWYHKSSVDSKPDSILTNFHIELIRIIQKYNYQDRRWERFFNVQIQYNYKGREIISPVMNLEPKQTGVPTEFANAIWEIDFRTCYIQNPIALKSFMTHLYREHNPKEVRILDHFGFVTIDRNPYYLAKNTLIPLNENEEGLLVFKAPDQDSDFQVSDSFHVALDPDLDGEPWIDNLGVGEDGIYKQAWEELLDASHYRMIWIEAEVELSEMIAGQDSASVPEGSLVLGYVFSHLIFDEIYTTFNHVIYLYLYGPGNSGKGSLCEIILSFFGLPFYPSPNPTKSALETLLSTHSKIPLWIDEFVPEHTPGKRNMIPDQYWNSYFQLTDRRVSSTNRYKVAAPKPIRASVLFCSNYLPKTDHFNSRLLKLEYTVSKRGDERHYRTLQQMREELQTLFLSAIRRRQQMSSTLIRRELYYLKTRLHEQAKIRLDRREEAEGIQYTLHDRQTEQYAAICLAYYLFESSSAYYQELQEIEQESEKSSPDPELLSHMRQLLDENQKRPLFQYCIEAIVKHSREEAERDPLSEFLEVVGDLTRSADSQNYIQKEKHFHWSGDGDLLLWWAAVWNRYAKHVGIQQAAEIKGQVTKAMDALDEKGCRHNVNWTATSLNGSVRQWGYRIANAGEDERLKRVFQQNE